MTERITVNLTDGDISVAPEYNDDPDAVPVVNYIASCPMCNGRLVLTRINSVVCDCNLSWIVDIKIKGSRALDDDDKFQLELPLSKSKFNTPKPEAPEPETVM